MFRRYSSWNKWDLHIHTRASKLMKGNNEYFGEGAEFLDNEIEDFVNNIFIEEGPKLIAITDHDTFNSTQFLKIKKQVYEKSNLSQIDLNCLPGVELDIVFRLYASGEVITNSNDFSGEGTYNSKRCQVIIIFNDDYYNFEASKYEEITSIIESFYSDDSPILLNKIVNELVDKEFEFIIMPHFTKDNDIEEAIKDNAPGNMRKKMKWILSSYFPILDGSKSNFVNNSLKEIYQNITNNDELRIPAPIVLTSDNHDYRDYDSSELTLFKSLITFKGLKMSLTDTEQRLAYENRELKPTYISEIRVNNIGANKVVFNNIIQLSDGLNCVIGGRSSGKSLLLKEIVNKVNPKKVADELKDYPKYHNNFDVELINSRGEQYVGNPEYFSQGDILKKFQNIKRELSLREDFGEYFPKNINTEEIERRTSVLISNIDNLDKKLSTMSEIRDKIRNIDIYDYLNVEKLEKSASFSNDNMRNYVEYSSDINNNLMIYLGILEDSRKYLIPFEKLLEKHDDLMKSTKEMYSKTNKRLEVYKHILKASDEFIKNLNAKFSDKVKRNKELTLALNNISKDVGRYSRSILESKTIIETITNILPAIAENTVSENQIGRHKFTISVKNELSITNLLESFREYYKKFSYSDENNLEELLKWHMENDYESNKTKDLLQLTRKKIDEKLRIEYLIYEDDELINEMSEGRKVGVFLDLVLNRRGSIEPLIIDQPEDDMDNEDIYKILVNTLRKVKNIRQVIIASHDANVVVNGDSENVIFAEKKGKLRINYKFGALEYEDDEIDMQKKVCSILEGGETAFINRSEKYDLSKIKLSKWEE